MPLQLLVPLRVTTLIAAPLLRPSSAEKFEVWIFTCSMKLEADVVDLRAVRAGVEVEVPSMVRLLVLLRLPLIDWPVTLSDGRQAERIEVGGDRAGNQRGQLEVVAAVEGEIADLLRSMVRATSPLVRLTARRATACTCTDSVNCADAEREVRAQPAVGAELQPGPLRPPEALQLGGHRVGADRQVGGGVDARSRRSPA